MRYRYAGTEATYDCFGGLGLLLPGQEGEGPDDVVALKIAAGLLEAVEVPIRPESELGEEGR